MNDEKKQIKSEIAEQIGNGIANQFNSPQMTFEGSPEYIAGLPIRIMFGDAADPLPLHEETPISLTGILDTPARWVEARGTDLVEGLTAYVMVDREKLSIELVTEERNHFKNKLVGKLEYHPAFLKFGINSEVYITPAQMADKIKMHRSFFEQKQDAMNLVAILKDFKATIDAKIEKRNDNQGNVRDLRQMEVTSNMPKSFNMKLPIFKGEKAKVFEVEVYIEAGDLTCTLISPEANEEMEALRDTAIDAVIKRIKDAIPSIVVLEK